MQCKRNRPIVTPMSCICHEPAAEAHQCPCLTNPRIIYRCWPQGECSNNPPGHFMFARWCGFMYPWIWFSQEWIYSDMELFLLLAPNNICLDGIGAFLQQPRVKADTLRRIGFWITSNLLMFLQLTFDTSITFPYLGLSNPSVLP